MMILTVILIVVTIIPSVGCACTNCDKCVDDKCEDPQTKCRCEYGCKPGYYGNKCLATCPDQCVSCGREYGLKTHSTYNICYECEDGYHNGSSTNCLCPVNCQNCTSTTTCTICYKGWYGSVCESQCPSNCHDGVCCKTDGVCTLGCKNGWYGSKCLFECPVNCQNCTSNTTCSICNNGWHGTVCASKCPSNCQYNICSKTGGSCTRGCKNSWYGSNCTLSCPDTCKDNICSQSGGTCTNGCKNNFALGDRNLCNVCIAGKYGQNCESECLSTTCLNNECDQQSGKCANSCRLNFALGEDKLCRDCKPGKYDSDCNSDCPAKCLNKTCERVNGICTHGCDSWNIVGDNCDTCVNGTYGDDCMNNCSINCKDSICSRNQGNCINGCINKQFYGSKCEHCNVGFYGEYCNTSCPPNCNDSVCNKGNGSCSNGCVGNYDGKKCDACRDGYYGTNCSKPCKTPSGCMDGICNRKTGQCDKCKAGNYGIFCNQSCSSGCNGSECEQLNGNCSNGCNGNYTGNKCCSLNGFCEQCENTTQCAKCESGYFSYNCNLSCPTNCQHNCEKETGTCVECIHGYYGAECDIECSDTCQRESNITMCDIETGKCLHGCLQGYTNANCTENCSTNCLDGVCDQNTGFCSNCSPGYHGNKCDSYCSEQCVNTTCYQTDGECHHGCSDGFEGSDCTKASPVVDNNVAGPVAGGVSAALVVIAIVLVGCLVFRKWKRDKNKQPRDTLEEFSSVNDIPTTSVLDSKNKRATNDYENSSRRNNQDHNYIELKNEGHQSDDTDPEEAGAKYANISNASTKIKLSDLHKFVTNKDSEYFKREFQLLPRSKPHAFTAARKSENRALNRFKGIYPYDHTRVKLKDDPNFFINACYINGYDSNKAYIASVGPTVDITNRFISFWKMVWYENVEVIVMLTNLMETTGMKCERYWPEVDTSCTYGDITVTHQTSSVYAEYTLTNMTVAKGRQERSLTHMHYTAWPDKSVPDHVLSLVQFRQRVKTLKADSGGPTLVHCSAGVGRTGTYIALDILTDQGKTEQYVDVLDCVNTLREQRVNMVQTYDQYQYLYRGIVYTLIVGSEPVAIDNIQTFMVSKDDEFYTKQFQNLELEIEMESDDEKEAQKANRLHSDKNRPGADIPGNRNRPRLFLNRAFNEPDYINAAYINSFKKINRFISAQTPLPTSLTDFLCLIYQNKCSCIVDMNDAVSYGQHKVGVYLPEADQTIVVDSFTVSCSKLQTNKLFTKSILTIKNTSKQMPGEIKVEHYQYLGWKHENEIPDDVKEFVHFVNSVQVTADSQSEDSSPMLIHCMNAFERSGLFCTIAVLLEKLECEQQVSFSNTVRHVRLVRRKAIPNKAQYQFCHQCAPAFIDMFSTYSNFAM